MGRKVGYQQFEDDGSARVAELPRGPRKIRFLAPKLQAVANFSNANEFVSIPAGVLAYRVTALIIPGGEAVIVAHSTTEADAAALKATIDAVTEVTLGKWDLADGTPFANLFALVANATVSPWTVVPEGARIRSIGLQQTGGTPGLCILETIGE